MEQSEQMAREIPRKTGLLAVLLALVAALLSGFPGVARAYEVTPMRIFLQPERGQASATITINNVRDEALPVEIAVFRRRVASDGEQTFEPADDEFIVFPPQAQIGPSQSQAVRVQYIGDLGEIAEAFVVQVTEVPVNRLEGTGIQFTYNFGVAVYVQPPRARARLSVRDAQLADGALRFQVTNSGNDFGFLTGQALEYRIGSARVSLTPDELATVISNPIVPPQATRDFVLDLPDSGTAQPGTDTVEVRLVRGEG
jgi:fimbrial chaperone protein